MTQRTPSPSPLEWGCTARAVARTHDGLPSRPGGSAAGATAPPKFALGPGPLGRSTLLPGALTKFQVLQGPAHLKNQSLLVLTLYGFPAKAEGRKQAHNRALATRGLEGEDGLRVAA